MVETEKNEKALEQKWAFVCEFYKSVFESDLARLTSILSSEVNSVSSPPDWEKNYLILSLCVSSIASKSLPELKKAGFQLIDSEGGLIIIHSDFLAIQNEWANIETDEKIRAIPWSSQHALKALKRQLILKKQQRRRHNDILNAALNLLNQEKRKEVQKTMKNLPARFSPKAIENLVLVALPSIYDNPELYRMIYNNNALFEIMVKLFNKTPWFKVDESGIILASKQYRDDDLDIDEDGSPHGHDFFSWVADKTQGDVAEMISFSDETGNHEGDHWIIDVWLNMVMDAGETCNWISEGLVNALTEREQPSIIEPDCFFDLNTYFNKFSSLGQQKLIHFKHELIYNAGALCWESIRKLVEEKMHIEKKEAWSYIFKAFLEAGLKIKNATQFHNQHDVEHFVFISVLNLLEIQTDEFKQKYLTINQKRKNRA